MISIALLPPLAVYATTQYLSGDTAVLIDQVRVAVTDIGRGQLTGWTGHFALLGQLPTAVMVVLGLSDPAILRGLVILNMLVLLAATAWAFQRLRQRSQVVAVLFVATLLSGPLLWYGHASFTEMMAAALTLAIVILLLDGAAAPLVVLAMVGTSIAKDTSLPFVVLLSIGSAFSAGPPGVKWYQRARLPTVIVGTLVSAIAVGGFNLLRFNRLTNPSSLDPSYFVPSLRIQVRFFVGIWLSPNGGVLTFWPTFGAFMLLAVAAAVAVARHQTGWRQRGVTLVPLATAVAVQGGVTLGLSKWLSPLGWIAWGPRLLLPWLPATAFLLAWAHAEQIEGFTDRLRRNAVAIVIPLTLVLASLPQYVILFRPSLWDSLFAPDAVCPRIPYIENGADYYYRCTIHQMFSKHSVLLDAYHPAVGWAAFVLAAICCVAWLWFTITAVLAARPRNAA